MNIKYYTPIILSLILGCSSISTKSRTPAASAPFPPVADGSLFSSYDIINIELEAPLTDLFKDRKAKPFFEAKDDFVNGTLSYVDGNQKSVKIPVEIHLKGFTSLVTCPFPKMELKIKSENLENTLFADTKAVDLNTHCAEPDDESVFGPFKTSFYNHREALLYRMADVLEIPSQKARPVLVHYKGTGITSVDQSKNLYRAFLLEDMGALKKRLGAKDIKGATDPMKQVAQMKNKKSDNFLFTNVKDSPKVDPEDAARIALFETLAFNADWFLKMNPEHRRNQDPKERDENLWNIKMLEMPNGRWIPIPQDYSLSGMVLPSSYITLNKTVFDSVSKESQKRIKQSFLNKKPELYSLIETLQHDPAGQELFQKNLDVFFAALETL